MPRRFLRPLYLVLLPAIVAAAGVLAYYTWQTTSQYAGLGEQALLQSTLLLVREKVDQVEQRIITADNAVLQLFDPLRPEDIELAWRPVAGSLTPSVQDVVVLDEEGSIVAFASRQSAKKGRRFKRVFSKHLAPELELDRLGSRRLKHLHGTAGQTSYLLGYSRVRQAGRSYVVVIHHDTEYLRHEFETLFATEEGRRVYNVVDESNRRVFGPSLAEAGDYLVGRRFPTTLYRWRLQIAPEQAPLLEAQQRSQQLTQAALIAVSLLVIVLGVAFLIYAAEKADRLNAMKSDFIANVSHELKTPLSVIRMFAEMLLTQRVGSEEKRVDYLRLICQESERLSTLIENVLDFAALERGQQKYDLRDGDLALVATRALEAFRYRLQREGTQIRFQCDERIPTLQFDEEAILLAVINLLDNAVKYGGGSPVELRIERRNDTVDLSVRDHGPGIAPADTKRVFERFYRVRDSKSQVRGSGIGLSLVKHIAEAHGGQAWAVNDPEGGAIVGMTIPTPKTQDLHVRMTRRFPDHHKADQTA